MTQECEGIMGTIFGHKIKSLIKNYKPQSIGDYEGYNLEGTIAAKAIKEYKILCVRCGLIPDDKGERKYAKRTN